MRERRFQAVALDLFDTLVKWDVERLPVLELHGREIHSTLPLLLPHLEKALGERFHLDVVLQTFLDVTQEIDVVRRREGIEIPCRERFARTLQRLGVSSDGSSDLAEELTRLHMSGVRSVTAAPAEYVAAVRQIAGSYRLGLVSNFDDSRTGHEIVEDTGVAELFEVVLISADVGFRKPDPRIFRRLLDLLKLPPAQVLFVGDMPREDLSGASSVGMPVAWLAEGKGALPEEIPPPDFTLSNLAALPSLLEIP